MSFIHSSAVAGSRDLGLGGISPIMIMCETPMGSDQSTMKKPHDVMNITYQTNELEYQSHEVTPQTLMHDQDLGKINQQGP